MQHEGLDEWMKLPEETRKGQEQDMQTAWNAWVDAHKEVLLETAGVGRPKRVSAEGVTDARNDMMLYSFVEAESLEAAVAIFKDHPHFGIPGAWIEVVQINVLPDNK